MLATGSRSYLWLYILYQIIDWWVSYSVYWSIDFFVILHYVYICSFYIHKCIKGTYSWLCVYGFFVIMQIDR